LVPWREELLKGLLGADLIGFHTFDDSRHFLNAVSRILNLPGPAHEIVYEGRKVMADAFPMGIDYEKYRKSALNDKTKKNERKLRQMTGDKKKMISIDRLDYTKGIIQRLQAYELFLKKYPQLREDLVLIQLIVPSRDNVKQYAALKEEINRMVSDINARYGNLNWQPIYYFYRSFPMEMISAIYASADIALVAPLRDGMNLVSKEYIASKTNRNGVLILSELAGASKELYDALIINPHNSNALADAIYQALTMPGKEQKRRMENMQQVVQKFNIQLWIKNFMARLKSIKDKQIEFITKNLQYPGIQTIVNRYRKSSLRLLFLDYDGTLVPFEDDPLKAKPDKELIQLLQNITVDSRNKLILISGRKKDALDQWFGHMKLDIIAEHGAWIKKDDLEWQCNSKLNNDWKESILPLLKQYEMRTPGSFIEEKSFSLAWHYRKADSGLGELRAQEIIHNLNHVLSGSGLQLLQGSKVIEIKSMHIHKGRAAEIWIHQREADFILAMGDDVTDEDTFKAMPEGAVTIKIGTDPTAAAYYVKNLEAGRAFLKQLIARTDLP
jgi:trehalose 6-phosphate synthase/phosphatase